MKILSGKELRPILKDIIQKEMKGADVSFYLFSDKEDFPSQAYLRGIKKTLDSFQVDYVEDYLDRNASKKENIEKFKARSKGRAILLARPLKVDYENELVSLIPPNQDADMFHIENRGKLFSGDLRYLTATSKSVEFILEQYHIETEGKKAVILGRSLEVGYPCFQLLNKKNAAVTLLHSKVSPDVISSYVRDCDILVLATGKSNLVRKEDIPSKAIIIDCGFNPHGGDLGFIPKEGEVKAYTPVPGGVGALTSYFLLENAVFLKKQSL